MLLCFCLGPVGVQSGHYDSLIRVNRFLIDLPLLAQQVLKNTASQQGQKEVSDVGDSLSVCGSAEHLSYLRHGAVGHGQSYAGDVTPPLWRVDEIPLSGPVVGPHRAPGYLHDGLGAAHIDAGADGAYHPEL